MAHDQKTVGGLKDTLVEWRVKKGGPTYDYLTKSDTKWTSYFTDCARPHRPTKFTREEAGKKIRGLKALQRHGAFKFCGEFRLRTVKP